MEKWLDACPEAVGGYLDGHRLDEVECIIADLAGTARGKAMPASKFARQVRFFLPESIFYQTISGDWGEVEVGNTEPDMILKPDFSTATAAPWTKDKTLQVIHDAYDQKDKPIPTSPRNVLKRVCDLYRKAGWKPIVAPEMEFYLVARNTDPRQPVEAMMGRTGRPAAQRQAYSMSAVDEYGPVIDDIYEFAEQQGYEIDGITQEGGAGQVEINLRHGDPVKLADEIFFFKRLIREAALRHDCFATFMAKPIEGEPGSSMHIHHSVTDLETGRNLFSGPQGGETDAFYHFIGGLQKHLPEVIAILAPYVNSYRRYVKDHAAPINLAWGRDNRTAGIRIPVSDADSRRVENRLAGMDCNPYLGIAASLACGYLGLKNEERAGPSMKGDAYADDDSDSALPKSMHEALDLFAGATKMRKVLGNGFCETYEIVKQTEYEEFLQVISPWEREHLLLNV